MSHLHFPDGFLPLWLWLAGLCVTALITAFFVMRTNRQDTSKHLPLVAVMAAVMIVGMSLEIVPLAYHINLAVPSGILLGPALGFIATLVVNIFLALFGHGGITTIGLNTLTVGSEVILGWVLFRHVVRFKQVWGRVFLSTFGSLTLVHLALLFMLAFTAPSLVTPPEEEGLVHFEWLAPKEEDRVEEVSEVRDIKKFLAVTFGLSTAGSLIESLISATLITYLIRFRPTILKQ